MDAVVYLIRHGMHDWLRPGSNRLAGRLPGVALNEQGRGEMARVGQALHGRTLNWIVASPLQRTVESAELIARLRGLEVERDDRFIEWAFGPWEGLEIGEIQAQYPREWQLWREDPVRLRLPGGEALEEVADRMEAGAQAWMDRGGAGVIVSHQDPLAALLCRLIGMPLGNLRALDIRTGSVSLIRRWRHGVAVESINALVPLR